MRLSSIVILLMEFACVANLAATTTGITTGAARGMTNRSQQAKAFVRVSPRDRRYFELSDGQPFVPVGPNIAFLRFITDEKEGLAKVEEYFRKLSEQGGNFTRVWLSHPFFNIEPARTGEYDAAQAKRIDMLVGLARRYGIRIKFCIEHFRTLDRMPPKFPGSVSMGNPLYNVAGGGAFRNITEYFGSDAGRALYKKKLDFYAARYRDEPSIFGWELWNEIDSVRGRGWAEWTEAMLNELRATFPNHLAMQSMGSFDAESKRDFYRTICLMPGNDVAQIHRYLDQGARLEVCRGAMDVLAVDAIRELQSYDARKPVLLSEVGAVEPGHAAPSKLYEVDKEGTLLHDLLFAPFFAGAAGPGQSWHWHDYVDRNDLWYHFGRFAKSIKDLDPPSEGFEPVELRHPRMRVYALRGRRTFTAWCRDTASTWQSELVERQAPRGMKGVTLDLRQQGLRFADDAIVRVYDPWKDRWTTHRTKTGVVVLPDFIRSIVVRIEGAGR